MHRVIGAAEPGQGAAGSNLSGCRQLRVTTFHSKCCLQCCLRVQHGADVGTEPWFGDNQATVHGIICRSCSDQPMIHLICSLFFLKAWFEFEITASHLPGVANTLADDLSRNHCLIPVQGSVSRPDTDPPAARTTCVTLGTQGLDLSTLDGVVRFYCDRGLADSTHKTYWTGLNRYLSMCFDFEVLSPFPVSESISCYFVTALARQGISPATIKPYLAATDAPVLPPNTN